MTTQFSLNLHLTHVNCDRLPMCDTEGEIPRTAATLVSKVGNVATFRGLCAGCGMPHIVTRRAPSTNVTRPVRGDWREPLPASLTVGKLAHVLCNGVETGYKMFIADAESPDKLGNVELNIFYKRTKKGEETSTLMVDGNFPASWLIDISEGVVETHDDETAADVAALDLVIESAFAEHFA